jgi:hypothetical protein
LRGASRSAISRQTITPEPVGANAGTHAHYAATGTTALGQQIVALASPVAAAHRKFCALSLKYGPNNDRGWVVYL